jgi:hypothetical protein
MKLKESFYIQVSILSTLHIKGFLVFLQNASLTHFVMPSKRDNLVAITFARTAA